MKRQINFLIITLVLGFASEWGPYYVSLFSGDNIRIVGHLARFGVPCTDPPIGEAACKRMYRIPAAELGPVGPDFSIGLGVILPPLQVSCSKSAVVKSIGSFNPYVRSFDYTDLYQTISMDQLKCSGDVIVKAWAFPSVRRYGAADAPVVVGPTPQVLRVDRFVEFSHTGIMMMFVSALFCIFFFNRLLVRLTSESARHLTGIEAYDAFLPVYLFLTTELLSTLVPGLAGTSLMRWAIGFSLSMACFGPVLAFTARATDGPKMLIRVSQFLVSGKGLPWRMEWVYVAAALFLFYPAHARTYSYLFLVFGLLAGYMGARNRSATFTILGVVEILDSLKMFGIPFIPNQRMTTQFLVLNIGNAFFMRAQAGVNLLNAMRWTRRQIEEFTAGSDVARILRDFADQFGIGRITLFSPKPSGGCRLEINQRSGRSWEAEDIVRDETPSVFSRVLTTGTALWHVEEKSSLSLSLRGSDKATYSYNGHFFSIVPLVKDGITAGAIGMTSYDEEYRRDPLWDARVEASASVLFPFLAGAVAHKNLTEREGWRDLCAAVAQGILGLKESVDDGKFVEALSSIAQIIQSGLNCSVLLGRFDASRRRFHVDATAGFEERAEAVYSRRAEFDSYPDDQDPLSVCIRQRKPILAGDISWMISQFPPHVREALELNGAKSCAILPIIRHGQIWGAVWIESRKAGTFLPQSQQGLQVILEAFELFIGHVEMVGTHARMKEALAGFVPARIATRLVEGATIRQEGRGYLLLADLRDSTRLSRSIGAESWARFTKKLGEPAADVAKEFGFDLQSVVWDALYFTLDAEKSDAELRRAIRFASGLNSLFQDAYRAEFGSFLGSSRIDARRTCARFCLVYGDITRDVRSAFTNYWTIVGDTMASVSKLEQACKTVSGWFFVPESALSSDARVRWQRVSQFVEGTGEAAFSLRERPTTVKTSVRWRREAA